MSLHEAARLGDRELVKKLVKKDGRKNCVNLEDAYGQTPLHIAAEEGHAELVQLLADKYGARVNARDQAGWTPLFCACKWGRARVADLLLHRGADAGVRSNDNATALHYFVRHDYTQPTMTTTTAAATAAATVAATAIGGGHGHGGGGGGDAGLALRVLRGLLESGADQNAQNTNGEVPLHVAAYTGVVPSVEALLSLGSAPDATDRNGETPLHHAARRGHTRVIALLLDYGADRTVRGAESGLTPRELAQQSGQADAAQLLDTYVPVPPVSARGSRDDVGAPGAGGSGARGSLNKVKLVLLGDTSTNKTQVLAAYARTAANSKLRQLAPAPAPSDGEGGDGGSGLQVEGEVVLDGRAVAVELIDAPVGDAARAALMPLTSLFLVFFSVIDPDSYANALKKWVPEACYHCPGTSFVLVGLNAHLRSDPATLRQLKSRGIAPVTTAQATELAKRAKAIKYLEFQQQQQQPTAVGEALGASAQVLFEEVVRAVVFPTTRHQREMAKRERMLEKVRTEVAAAMAAEENRGSGSGGELSFKKKGWDSTHIPKSFGKDMRDIRKLVLSDNKLFFFPLALLELTKLQTLELRNNALTFLPDALPRMSSLKKLDVENNQLSALPGEMGAMTHLEELKLRGNLLDQFLPPEAQANGTRGILAYLRDLHKGAERCYRMKIMFVGKEAAGKTSLSYFLLNNKKMERAPLSTDGIDINSWEIPFSDVEPELGEKYMRDNWSNKPISFSVWDFAGQEVYYSTHQFYLSRRSMYLVAFNLMDDDILKGDYHRVSYWLQSVTAKARGAPVVVVGTRADLVQPSEIADVFAKMQQQFAHFGVKHYLAVSSHTGKGLKELRTTLIELSLKQRTMGEQIPRAYLELEGLVQRKRQELLAAKRPPTLPYGEYRAMALNALRIDDDEALLRATEFLHELGSLVYFRKPGLSDITILDPHWLTQVMATVVSSKTSLDRGVLPHKFLTSHIWKGDLYPAHLHDTLLLLLEKFQITFRLRRKRAVLRAVQDTVGPTPNQLSFRAGDKILLLEKAKVGKWWKGLHNGHVGYFQQTHIRETREPPEFTLEDESLVPCLLPTDPPPGTDKHWPAGCEAGAVRQIGRRWRFDFLPLPFFPQLIVRLLHFMESRVHWRYAVVIEAGAGAGAAHALVRVDHSEGHLTALVRGDDEAEAAELMSVLEEEVDTLREWFGVTFTDVAAPCPHCWRERVATPHHFFAVEALEAASANDVAGLPCPRAAAGPASMVALRDVAPDIAMTSAGCARVAYADLRLADLLGEGAYADVFRGTLGDETVAVKKLKNAKGFKEFRTEVKFMSGEEHENIVSLRGVCLNPPCVITEYMELGNLHGYLGDHRNVIEWRQVVAVARDVARGMHFLHSQTPPKIHRDLKSPNILLGRRNDRLVAKVADFGTSRSLAPTIGGRMVDNPIWLAPEVMRNEEYTEKADVYSFGIILFELYARAFPFGRKTRFQIELDVVAGLRPDLPADCPPAWAALAKECWHDDPRVRPSFGQVLERLGETTTSTTDSAVAGAFLVPVAYRAMSDCPYALPLGSGPASSSPSSASEATPFSLAAASSSSTIPTAAAMMAKVMKGEVVFVPDVAPPYRPATSPVPLLHGGLALTLSLDALATHFEPLDFERTPPAPPPASAHDLTPHRTPIEYYVSRHVVVEAAQSKGGGESALSSTSSSSRTTSTGGTGSAGPRPAPAPAAVEEPVKPPGRALSPAGTRGSRAAAVAARAGLRPPAPVLVIPLVSEFGLARVLEGPPGALPAAATRLDNSAELKDDWEVVVQVEALWVDRRAAAHVRENEAETGLGGVVARVVEEQGRFLHRPTDSSALLLGSVLRLGASAHAHNLAQADARVVACGSLRGVPLALSSPPGAVVGEQLLPAAGTAVVPPSVPLVVVPPLLPPELALLALDLSASLHQVERLLLAGGDDITSSVVVIGCGRAGLMTLAFVRRVAPKARVIAVDVSLERVNLARTLVADADTLKQMDAKEWAELVAFVRAHTGGRGADVVLNCTVAPHTEAASLLAACPGGTVVLSPQHRVDKERLLGGLAGDVELVVGGGGGAVAGVVETVFELLLADRPLNALFSAIARLPPTVTYSPPPS